jgi:tRNA A64-2'-O-ribosylphosphate transferase
MFTENNSRAFQTQALAELRKETLDVYNRLHSIAEDVEFVNKIHRHYSNIPMIRKCPFNNPRLCTHTE